MRLLAPFIALVVLFAAFAVLERLWPAVRGQRRLRPGLLTDLAYYTYTVTAGKLLTGVFVAVCVLGAAGVFAVPISVDQMRGLMPRDTLISRQPVGLQFLEFLVLADFFAYWQHRAFHHFGALWRIHAVHHSSTQLDWLSSVRVHPLNDAIGTAVVATPLLLLGFTPATLAAYLPLLTLYAIAIHANVSWGLGPLGAIIVGPRVHRWHHSAEAAALNKNFGGFFTVWDRLFGTFYLPKGVQPQSFGVYGAPLPDGFLGQLAYPLHRAQPAEAVQHQAV